MKRPKENQDCWRFRLGLNWLTYKNQSKIRVLEVGKSKTWNNTNHNKKHIENKEHIPETKPFM